MNNQTKSQRKATTPTKEEKTTTRMRWLLRKLYHIWVASRKTRKHLFLKEEDSPGETRCKKSWDRFEEYDSLSLRYVKQVSGANWKPTANGEVQTREEATVYVKELDLYMTVMLLEETHAVRSLGKPCEDHGYTYRSGQKTHLTKKGKNIDCNISNYAPFVVPGLSTITSTTPTPASSSSSSQDYVLDVSRYTENPVPERKWKCE